jgi:CBS domain-containing protein/SAM-dependent methyltransferase
MPAPDISIRAAMSLGSPRLAPGASLTAGAQLVWQKGWLPIPVVDGDGRLTGVLSANDVARAVAQGRDVGRTTVGEIAATELPALRPDASLEEAAAAMDGSGQPILLVVDDSRLVGVLTYSDLQGHELIAKELGAAAADVIREISPNDIMYSGSWGAYTYAGVTALQCIRDVLGKLGRPDPASILDLPCGHGRELRFLKLAYPDARMGACDIDEDGVEFCARVFGADPIVSVEDPAAVLFDRQYELAWSGSLFTHLSAERWPGFLEMFARAVEPDGLVLFTANGFLPAPILSDFGLTPDQMDRLLGDFRSAGFGYVDVGDGSWGLSLARPHWVKEQIARSPLELVSYDRWAWKPPYPAQDVLVCRLPAS